MNGHWGSIVTHTWGKREATVVCRELGFPEALDVIDSSLVPQGLGMVWLMEGNCSGNEERLIGCKVVKSKVNTSHGRHVGVKCKPGMCFNIV